MPAMSMLRVGSKIVDNVPRARHSNSKPLGRMGWHGVEHGLSPGVVQCIVMVFVVCSFPPPRIILVRAWLLKSIPLNNSRCRLWSRPSSTLRLNQEIDLALACVLMSQDPNPTEATFLIQQIDSQDVHHFGIHLLDCKLTSQHDICNANSPGATGAGRYSGKSLFSRLLAKLPHFRSSHCTKVSFYEQVIWPILTSYAAEREGLRFRIGMC